MAHQPASVRQPEDALGGGRVRTRRLYPQFPRDTCQMRVMRSASRPFLPSTTSTLTRWPGPRALTPLRRSAVMWMNTSLPPPSQLGSAQTQPAAAVSRTVPPERVIFDKYCISCHNERRKTAGLMLDTMDVTNVGEAEHLELRRSSRTKVSQDIAAIDDYRLRAVE